MSEKRFFPKTDLAIERRRADLSLPGTRFSEERRGRFTVSSLSVSDRISARAIGKPIGRYITVAFPEIAALAPSEYDLLADTLRDALQSLIPEGVSTGRPSVLVAGLGNRGIVSDAVGAKTADGLTATAHLAEYDPELFRRLGCAKVAVSVPGVLGETGVEAATVLSGICRTLCPDFVICVDSLAARAVSRLLTTVQFSDTGIRPGSGIGNSRSAVDRETLGVPVLSIGVPTVVEAATLVSDYLAESGARGCRITPGAEHEKLFVTPKDVDFGVGRIASLLATVLSRLFSLPAPG